MKNKVSYIKITALLLVVLIISCKKDDNNPSNPTNGKTMAIFNPDLTYGTLTDIDGNEYKTIKIGNQTWMAENLRTFKYNDGTAIPNIKGNTEWAGLSSGAYCTIKNTTKNDSIATFGCLYNWYAVNTGKLAPEGWHIATKEDWKTLIDYLIANGYNYDGTTSDNKVAKSVTTSGSWSLSTTTGAPGSAGYSTFINKSGFTGLSSGVRGKTGVFDEVGDYFAIWCATPSGDGYAYHVYLSIASIVFGTATNSVNAGFSVRCIKD